MDTKLLLLSLFGIVVAFSVVYFLGILSSKESQQQNQSSSITTTLQASSIASSLAIEIGKNKIAAGGEHTCALLSDGSAKCWGDNNNGQLGDGTTIDRYTPVSVVGLTNAVAIDAGDEHTCALLKNGSIKCWGLNGDGQLGDGTTDDKYTPVAVSGITNAVAITTGYYHTCALLSDGTVKCWGSNTNGQLGDGKKYPIENYSTIPVTVSGITNAIGVTAGWFFTCALLKDGTVECWGDNAYGQLGEGSGRNLDNPVFSTTTPVLVSGITNAVAIAAGWEHVCALLRDETVKCWGYNSYGQLGGGTPGMNNYETTPVLVQGLTKAIAIDTGYEHTCALLSDGSVKCWGYNGYYQLGDGTTINRTTPVSVLGLTNVVGIDTTYEHTCALLSNGTIKCWGYNSCGRLGDGTATTRSTLATVKNYNYFSP